MGALENAALDVAIAKIGAAEDEIAAAEACALWFQERAAYEGKYDFPLVGWDPQLRSWWLFERTSWDGVARWRPDRTGFVQRLIAEFLGVWGATKLARKTARVHASIERLLTFSDRIVLEPGRWDEDPDLLGTPAGVINLRTGELRPHKPELRISKYTAVTPASDDDDWVPERWDRFLMEALQGDVDAIEALQQYIGYAATGHTREHTFLALLGRGGAGVSTFVNACMHVLGDYAKATAAETFTSSSTDKHPADLAALVGVRLVVAPEVERGRRWAESRLKSFTAGDPISARVMRGDPFTFRPVAKVIVTGNSLPGLSAVDPAIRRRLLVKEFNNVPATPQRDLLERLIDDEGPQILRWIIEGASIWYERGLDVPGSMRAAADRYLDTEDVLGIWLDECVEVDAGASESSAELFRSWRATCEARNEAPGTAKAFAQLLQGRGFKSDKNVMDAVSGRYRRGFRGLRLRT